MKYLQPGNPSQDAYIERFNGNFREDILDAYWFEDLEQLRLIAEQWRHHYIGNHPDSALGGLPPITYYASAVNSGKV